MDFARAWFLTIFLTFRSSKTTRSCFLTSSALDLWSKSLRCRATLDDWTANSLRVLPLFSEPVRVLENLLWRRFSLSSAFLRNRGCGIFAPSVVATSDFSPRSTPTGDANFSSGSGTSSSSSSSYTREACPLAVRFSDHSAGFQLHVRWYPSVEDHLDVPDLR